MNESLASMIITGRSNSDLLMILPTCSTPARQTPPMVVQVWAAIITVGRVIPDYTTAVDKMVPRRHSSPIERRHARWIRHFQRLTKHTDVILKNRMKWMHGELECSSIQFCRMRKWGQGNRPARIIWSVIPWRGDSYPVLLGAAPFGLSRWCGTL